MEAFMDTVTALFGVILNLSLVGSYVILFVLLGRLLLSRAPKWCSYILWGIVFVRLVCPVMPQGQFSLIPDQLGVRMIYEPVPETGVYQEKNNYQDNSSGEKPLNGQQMPWDNPRTEETSSGFYQDKTLQKTYGETEDLISVRTEEGWSLWEILGQRKGSLLRGFALVWVAGFVFLAIWHIISYRRFKVKMKDAAYVEEGIYEITGEHLSFVLGILKPRIYLAAGLDEESRKVVLCHEQVHLQRRDYLIKPLALAICCIHWFNPLVWLAFYLLNRDCEMSCDEKVVSLLGEESKKIYSFALLRGKQKISKRQSLCCISFGEESVKQRILHVLSYKKASVWVVGCAVILLVVLVAGLCRNPVEKVTENLSEEEMWELWVKDGQSMVSSVTEAYVENGAIVCVFPDKRLSYDVENSSFEGTGEKKYSFYYEDSQFKPYVGREVSREELVECYDNGAELLENLEELFSQGSFQYIIRENGLVHVNVAYQKSSYDNTVYFWNITYNGNAEEDKNSLIALEQSDGCYQLNILDGNEECFVERIAGEYGWQTEDSMAVSRMTPEAVLDTYAFAYQNRNGNVLYQLSYNKENFQNWDMVTPTDNGYSFGYSSPWVSHYSVEYLTGSDEAVIRFYLKNSVPEYYIAEEKVKLVQDGKFYCVDHVSCVEYSVFNTKDEVKQVYDVDKKSSTYNPFDFEATGYAQADFEAIFRHILNQTNPDYYKVYTNPLTAAKAYLNLGEGKGEVTEIKYSAEPWSPLSSAWGEGTIVNVRYTFSEDGSYIDIPMTLAEETTNLWVLCYTTDINIEKKATEKIGYASYENERVLFASNARIVYSVYTSEENAGVVYQVSSYGLYRLDDTGLCCIYTGYLPVDTQLTYEAGMICFPMDSQYHEGALDWMADSMCILNPDTGEYKVVSKEAYQTVGADVMQQN